MTHGAYMGYGSLSSTAENKMMTTNTSHRAIYLERRHADHDWLELIVIADRHVVVLRFEPAEIAGYKYVRTTVSDRGMDWPDMTCDEIKAYMLRWWYVSQTITDPDPQTVALKYVPEVFR